MRTGILWQVVYWLSTPVTALLAGILVWRRLTREFPFFFSYLVGACLADVARLVAYQSGRTVYGYTYWTTHLLTTIFIFLAAYELFMKRLFPHFHRIGVYRYLFSVAAVVITILATLTLLGGISAPVVANVIRTFDFLRVAILFFFVALMVFMGRQWSRYEFGIALGLSIDSTSFLILFAMSVRFGTLSETWRDLPVLAGDLVSLIWLITFLSPEKRADAPTAPVSSEVLEQARKWEETLKESVTGKKRPR